MQDPSPTTADPTSSSRPQARRRALGAVAVVVALSALAAVLLPDRSSDRSVAEAQAVDPASQPAADPYDPTLLRGQLSFRVDETLRPHLPEVEGLHDGDPPRRTARMAGTTGEVSDLVLGELVVASTDRAEVESFAARWNGTIVDVIEAAEPGHPADHLVRLDPSGVDAASGPDALLSLEPHQPGEMRFGEQAALDLVALAAIEGEERGLVISPNWLAESGGIAEGTSIESDDLGERNAFNWSFVRGGTPQDIGVGAAWQLLEHEGVFDGRTVRIMISDGGFNPNPDFPTKHKLRKAKWGEQNPMTCTNGASCPWHGTNVTLAAMAALDNEYGVAGPAGPVAELVAVQVDSDKYKRLRTLRDMVDEERPHVVNMSYSSGVESFRAATQATHDRNYKAMKDKGALLVAAAGNSNRDVDTTACIGNHCYETRLVVPCESKHVLCVGGMGANTAWKDGDSNYGSRVDARSVQLWGPYCVRGLANPPNPVGDPRTSPSCGTSVASPFVAGIAALLKAADPSLSPDALRRTLLDTAHVGGVHFDHLIPNQHQRRVNALAAVSEVLGVRMQPPTVRIDRPESGSFFSEDHWFDLAATARNFAGNRLPVTWRSDLDGLLGVSGPDGTLSTMPLSKGRHVLSATAVDAAGQEAHHSVAVEVGNTPPVVQVLAPIDGEQAYEKQPLDLLGFTSDVERYGALPDNRVTWEIRRHDGSLVFNAQGHIAGVPAHVLAPGQHTVRFAADDDGIVVSDEVLIDVLPIPPGEDPPTATIIEPTPGTAKGTGGGTVGVRLRGQGHDPQDGALSGTRFRWTARSQAGTTVTLCTGSNFGGGGGGGLLLGALVDCSDVEVQLGHDPAVAPIGGLYLPPTVWTITLEVRDSAGLPGKATSSVSITVHIA